jgi:hypothetical protein
MWMNSSGSPLSLPHHYRKRKSYNRINLIHLAKSQPKLEKLILKNL